MSVHFRKPQDDFEKLYRSAPSAQVNLFCVLWPRDNCRPLRTLRTPNSWSLSMSRFTKKCNIYPLHTHIWNLGQTFLERVLCYYIYVFSHCFIPQMRTPYALKQDCGCNFACYGHLCWKNDFRSAWNVGLIWWCGGGVICRDQGTHPRLLSSDLVVYR